MKRRPVCPSFGDILPAPAWRDRRSLRRPPSTAPGRQSPAAAPAGGAPASSAEPPASLDTRVAQVPPAPPPAVQRTPPAPTPSGDDKAAASPPAPPAAPAATPGGTEKACGNNNAGFPCDLRRRLRQSQAPAYASGGRGLAASGQSIYASPPPMAPAEPRHHFMSWLFHDDDDATVLPRRSSTGRIPRRRIRRPKMCFPLHRATRRCDADCKAPKKPCFLKVWIHDWKNSHGSGGDDCGHGGVCASAQTNAAACDSGTAAPKKPCFLKVWIHDLKNGHGSANGDCDAGAVYPSLKQT